MTFKLMRWFLRQNALLIATASSVVLGVVVGVLCRPLNPSRDTILLVGFPGEIFLRMLKMLMLPLIVASIITGVGNLKGASAGRMGMVSLLYYATSSVIALLIGIALSFIIRPGEHAGQTHLVAQSDKGTTISGLDVFLDIIRNMVPDNIVGAAVQHSRTVVKGSDGSQVRNHSGNHRNVSLNDQTEQMHGQMQKKIQLFDGANIIGLLLYCVVFGIILSRQGRQVLVISRFFAGLNTITLQMIKLVMWYSPVGIMFLIASQVMASKDLSTTGHTLGIYIATEMAGMAVHLLVALPLLYFILTRGNAFKVYLGVLQALLTALATSSSAATLPITIQCMEKRLKMDERIAGFVLPIGATVNMDGGANFAAVAPVFIALYNGVTLSFPDVLIISLTALLSSVGAAAVPGAGIPILLLVLKAIGLPDRGIPFLLTVDWFMDRLRTVVNVASDCLAVGITSRYTKLSPRHQEDNPIMPSQLEDGGIPMIQTQNGDTDGIKIRQL